jgi:hypothetical protein
MKGAQIATLIWLGNLLVLAGGGFIGYRFYIDIEGSRKTAFNRTLTTRVAEVPWQERDATRGAATALPLNQPLSPRVRPTIAATSGPVVDTPPPPDPTDEELRAKLEEWLNKEFKLIRTMGSSHAVIKKGTVDLVVFPGENFKKDFKEEPQVANLDLTVLSIHFDRQFNASDRSARPNTHVVMRGPASLAQGNQKYADKYFEVRLMLSEEATKPVDLSKLGGGAIETTSVRPPVRTPAESAPTQQVERSDSRPMDSSYDAATDTWTLGRNDYDNAQLANDLAQFARVVSDRDGNSLGIQITENIPQDNIVVQRGGRSGDIIKAINGQPVRSMADVRTIVRQQYNAGQTRFEVSYERDGVPGTKVFNVPR